MTKDSGSKGSKADKWAARSVRLSAALRENLKRRKEQARGRSRKEPGQQEPKGRQAEQETGSDAALESLSAEPKT